MLSTSRKVALVVLPAVLALATTAAILVISESYHDSNHRWTAIAAVLTGSALLAALVGLPIALFQLFVVERDIARLSLVPAMHYEQLRGMLERSQITVGQQVRFEFGDPPDGRQLFLDAFFAHFPELSKPFAEWDAAVARVEAARASFAAALERAADDAGVQTPMYDRTSILQRLKERTPPRLHLMLEEWPEDSVPVEGSVVGTVDVAGIRTDLPPWTANYGTTLPLGPGKLKGLVKPLVDLCNTARQLPEVRAVAEAQDHLTQLIPALSDEIKLHFVAETIPVAQQCPVCQRNLGG
jgi:hypothetical protein